MSTPKMGGVLGAIEALDTAISEMQISRNEYTSRLETLAHKWHRLYPEYVQGPRFDDRLSCTACTFLYVGPSEDGEEIVFGTTCTYCGMGAGMGVRIKTTWFERELAEEKTG